MKCQYLSIPGESNGTYFSAIVGFVKCVNTSIANTVPYFYTSILT